MRAVIVKSKAEKKRYLQFRRHMYRDVGIYVDNNFYMIKEYFAGKTSFGNDKQIFPIYVEVDGKILCEGIVIYASKLSEYIQLAFFEALSDHEEAVNLLISLTETIGKKLGCARMVVGLCGHVNYGLGLLSSGYERENSFTAAGNPAYYNTYFTDKGMEEVALNTYRIDCIDHRLDKYSAFLDKLGRTYTYRNFDRRQFNYYAKIYTDLNNECFAEHRYYYERKYIEDREMLKELFLFMKEDSVIFAFKGEEPVGFIMWYPDYNELARAGGGFGAREYVRNIFSGKKIETAKIMEYGVVQKYRRTGLPLGLINEIFHRFGNYGITRMETSWILDENADSNSFCTEICDSFDRGYVVYEKEIV